MKITIRKVLLCSISIFTSTVHATTANGPYIGLQLGWGMLNQGEFISNYINQEIAKSYSGIRVGNMSFNDTGRGGRFFLGYQINRYFAAEIGYYRFSQLTFNANISSTIQSPWKAISNLPLNVDSNIHVKTDAFDLMAKGILPVTNNLSVYGKLGIASISSDGSASIKVTTSYGDIGLLTTPSISIIYPAFGLGMNYDLSNQLTADLAWNHIQKIRPFPYPSIDFVSVGILYHFY